MSGRTKAFLLATLVMSVAGSAAAQTPVRIGVLEDMSSVFADSSGPGSVAAAQLAVEDFGGKVDGRPIEIVSSDHLNKPDVGSNIARRWFETDGVDAIVGLGNSAVALGVSELGVKYDKAILASGAVSSDITGSKCNANTVQWTVDGYSLAKAAVKASMEEGDKSWFFLTVDYAFGLDIERNASAFLQQAGAKVAGAVHHPLNTSDFASFLLQAQASKANVIALANGGQDTANAIKQAKEFGLAAGGQKMLATTMNINDIKSLGLADAQGLELVSPFYWDSDEATRAWSKRFAAKMNGNMPSMMQAGAYSATLHYLKAVAAAHSTEGKVVIATMKRLPTDDPLFGKGSVRADGRKLHPMALYVVKSPSDSKSAWDFQKLVRVMKPEDVFRPMQDGGCPLVNK